MKQRSFLLAIDQGTTSTKAVVIAADGTVVATSGPQQFAIAPRYPRPGWVEFDPDELWESVRQSAQAALRNASLRWNDLAGLGLANQGETVIAFDGETGRPIYPAISWQDRRGDEFMSQWQAAGLESEVFAITGLRLDSYFSAPKMAWILRHVREARELLAVGRLRLATSDAWQLWQLTRGEQFATDVATASRTMLLDLETLRWSERLAQAFDLPIEALPTLSCNATPIGTAHRDVLGGDVAITGLCVDQQAALFGQQACGAAKAKITYGTGCFFQANIGEDASIRAAGLITSVGWRNGGQTDYVLEGGVYSAGSLLGWLVALGLVARIEEVDELVRASAAPSPVMLIPAFSGLGAPRWSHRARACWLGMDQGTTREHLARAAIDAIAYRVREILDAMIDSGVAPTDIHVDGGLTKCDTLMRTQCHVLNVPLIRREFQEATALGVGYLAGLGSGLWKSIDAIPTAPADEDRAYQPDAESHTRYKRSYQRWRRACSAVVEMGDLGLFAEEA